MLHVTERVLEHHDRGVHDHESDAERQTSKVRERQAAEEQCEGADDRNGIDADDESSGSSAEQEDNRDDEDRAEHHMPCTAPIERSMNLALSSSMDNLTPGTSQIDLLHLTRTPSTIAHHLVPDAW